MSEGLVTPQTVPMFFWVGNNANLVEPNATIAVEECPTCFCMVAQKAQADHQKRHENEPKPPSVTPHDSGKK